jgi:glycosyltransferase involved in cell wall biosynthesis
VRRSRGRSVLHVLPHPGGGGETYVDALMEIDGYRFDRVYLASSANPTGARRSILRQALEVQRDSFSYDVVHVIGEVASTLCLPSVALRPSVVSPQGLSLLRRLSGASRQGARANLQVIVRAASRTICVSQAEYADVVDAVGAHAARRTLIIPNGVRPREPLSSEERAAARTELDIPTSMVVGAWVGALDENKDPMSAIQAACAVRLTGAPLTLLVVGDGPLRPDVDRLVGQADDGAVRVLGHCSDVRRILTAADFFVLSSRREGLSFALLEAMALGLAPVVSDAPANVEAVGDAGIVVPYRDVTAFVAAFVRLVESEPGRVALGDRARARVTLRFSAESMRARTREVYAALAP